MTVHRITDFANEYRSLDSRKGWMGVDSLDIKASIEMMQALGNPQDLIPSIHVAGTNGKGSVCSMLSSILISSGYRVAQFASPHLNHFTERLLIQGKPIAEEKLLGAIKQVIDNEPKISRPLSYFELLIAASFVCCVEEKVDWMVVEVGLGGRLDATNVMKAPKVSVITSIGIDHPRALGNTEEKIAREKAGIFRKVTPAFVGPVSEEARKSILEVASEKETKVRFLSQSTAEFPGKNFPQYKKNNISLAREVAAFLEISKDKIDHGIENAVWPGRLEEIQIETDSGKKAVLLDGAHNPDGVKGLIDYLSLRTEKEFVFLISIIDTKDSSSMLGMLKDWAADKKVTFYFCKMLHSKCLEPEFLAKSIPGSSSFETCQEGLEAFKNKLTSSTLGVLTGSLYFIGEIRSELVTSPFSTVR